MEKQDIIWFHKEDNGIVEFDSFGKWKCKLCGEISRNKDLIDYELNKTQSKPKTK